MSTKTNILIAPMLIVILFVTSSFGMVVSIHCTNSTESHMETKSSGTTYYIDITNGSDSNDGLSEETAWKTMAKVNSVNFNPADLILFKRGETWQEQLIVSSSGSSDNPITYGAYGNGNKPIINCASTISSWIQATPTTYATSVAIEPPQVFFNGIRGAPVALDKIDSDHEWNWTSNVLHIYSTSNPDATGVEIEASDKEFAIYIYSVSYITIKDIACKGAGIQDGSSTGIFMFNTNNVILDNLTVYDNAGYAGIFIYSDSTGVGENNIVCNCTVCNTVGTSFSINNGYNLGCGIQLWTMSPGYGGNNKICGNTVYKNGDHGIGLEFSNNLISNNVACQNGRSGIGISAEHSSGNIVERNTVYQNCQNEDDIFGINLYRVGNDNIVRYNIVHDQYVLPVGEGFLRGSGGIRFDGGSKGMTESTGNQIYYNLAYNEYDGVQIYNFCNVGIYNNVIYNSTRTGIYMGSGETISSTTYGNVVKNNVIHTSEESLIFNNRAGNNVFDHNVYYPDTPTSFNLNNIISDFATWKLNSGQDKDSKAENPLLVNIANNDFHLQSISPCIDAGIDVGLTQDFEGKSVPYGSAPDIGAYESEQVMFTGAVSGRVIARDTGLAIQGATVITNGHLGMTNSTGGFTITDIPAGTYTVTASMAGYQSQSRYDVSVQDNKTTIVDFELQENNFPDKPEKPSGPMEGKCWVPHTYFSSTIDIDNDKIRYGWDWDGDYVVDEWTLLYGSGEEVELNHSWYVTGYYEIRVKAMDVHGAESNWSDPLPVSMSKNKYSIKSMCSQLVERLLEKFPALERLIDRIFDKISNFKAGGTQNTIAFSPLSDSPIYEVDLNYLPSHSFDDLKDMMPDLENLGIKTIYILPIMETVFDDPAAAYLIKDHYEINSRYGDSTDLKELVNTAHSYGIRILLDFVTSLAYNGSYITENHPEWILTDDEGEMQKYFPFEDWGWAIDCTNPEVIEYFTGVASYYVEEFDIDGWRVDSPQNNYDWRKVSGDHSRLDLLRSVKSAITNTKPDAILMAEISGPTFIWGENDKNEVPLFDEMCEISYNYEFCGFMGGNFLFGYNYVLPNGSNMEELEETILNKIVHNTATSKEFADFVNNQLILHNRLRANFIENHDTSRVSEAFPKQQKALFVLVATMPGIPVIHAGQENAKIKNSDYYSNVASCNTGILGLEDFYIKILKIRSENEALRCGNLIDVWDNGDNTIAFVRHYNDNNAIVGLNFGSKTATSTLNIPIEELDIYPNEKYILFDEFKDVIIGEFIGVDLENLDIEIDPYGYRIITIHVEE